MGDIELTTTTSDTPSSARRSATMRVPSVPSVGCVIDTGSNSRMVGTPPAAATVASAPLGGLHDTHKPRPVGTDVWIGRACFAHQAANVAVGFT